MTNEPTLVGASIFPSLIVKSGGRIVDEVKLRGVLQIGRAEDNDLDLTDPKVSRHHARIEPKDDAFVLTDLGSANGTRINGVPLTGEHRLRHGDQIGIGDTELVYQEPRKATSDTLVSATPASAAAQPTITRSPALAVPPPQPPESSRAGSEGRGITIALSAAGILVILAIVVAAIYLFVPGVFGPAEPTIPPTQTPQFVVATATPATVQEATEVVSVVDPNAGGTATPSVSSELDDKLSEGSQLVRQSKFEEAVAIFQDLLAQAPNDARPEIGWAWALIWDHEPNEALAHAEKAVALDPKSSDAAMTLARVYIDLNDKTQALEEAQRAVDLNSGNAVAHAVLAEAYMLNGQTQKAVDEADLALVQNINAAEAHRIRAWLYHIVDNDMGRAAGELQIAAGLQPELWLRRHELGVLLLKAEDYTTAIMAFQDALGIRPKDVTYTAIGEAYYRLGQYDQAKASLQQAIAAGADDLNTHALMGVTLARLGRCEDAKVHYDRALDLDNTDPLASEALDFCEGSMPTPTPSVTTVSASRPTAEASVQPEATPKPASAPAKLSGRIAFPVWNRETSKYDVYVANVDGSDRKLVVQDMHQPSFSPDGKWLAVNGERDEHMNLFIVQPSGSGLKEISRHLEDSLPRWSPDSKSIVFSSTMHGDKQSRVYIIDDVPFVGRQEEGRALNFGPDDVRGEYPAWTKDNQIVYQGCDLTVEPAKCGLYIMSSAPGAHPTKQLTEFAEDTAPSASGSKIAFSSNRDGNWEIYAMEDDGTRVQRLTNNAAHDGLPIWASDGKSIVFVSDQEGGWAVWAMNADGSNRRKLFNIGGGGLAFDWLNEQISWVP